MTPLGRIGIRVRVDPQVIAGGLDALAAAVARQVTHLWQVACDEVAADGGPAKGARGELTFSWSGTQADGIDLPLRQRVEKRLTGALPTHSRGAGNGQGPAAATSGAAGAEWRYVDIAFRPVFRKVSDWLHHVSISAASSRIMKQDDTIFAALMDQTVDAVATVVSIVEPTSWALLIEDLMARADRRFAGQYVYFTVNTAASRATLVALDPDSLGATLPEVSATFVVKPTADPDVSLVQAGTRFIFVAAGKPDQGVLEADMPGTVRVEFLPKAPWIVLTDPGVTRNALAVELYAIDLPDLVAPQMWGGFRIEPNLLRRGYRARFDEYLAKVFTDDVAAMKQSLFDRSASPDELYAALSTWADLHQVFRDGSTSWFDAFLARLDADYWYRDYLVKDGAHHTYLETLLDERSDREGRLIALIARNSERFGLYRHPDAVGNVAAAPAANLARLAKQITDNVLERLEANDGMSGAAAAANSHYALNAIGGAPAALQAAILREIMSHYDDSFLLVFGKYGERRQYGMLYWLFEHLTGDDDRKLADRLIATGILDQGTGDALVEGRGFVARKMPYFTDMAIESTEYWADLANKHDGVGGGLASFMGGLSVLATPKVVDRTAVILGTAGLGAEFGPLLAANFPRVAFALTAVGVATSSFEAGVAVRALIDGHDASGRPLDDTGRLVLAITVISNVLMTVASVLSARVAEPAPGTGLTRLPPDDVLMPNEPAAGPGVNRPNLSMRLVSVNEETGEAVMAVQNLDTNEIAVARMNMRTGNGVVVGPKGRIGTIANYELAPDHPQLPGGAPGKVVDIPVSASPVKVPAVPAARPGALVAPPAGAAPRLAPGAAGTRLLPLPATVPEPVETGPASRQKALGPGFVPKALLGPARYNTLDEILPDKGGAFVVQDIESAYLTYAQGKAAPQVPAPRSNWVTLTRGAPRALLLRWLGPNFPTIAGERVYLKLSAIARPTSLTDQRLADFLKDVFSNPAKLSLKYRPDTAIGATTDDFEFGSFSSLKGPVGELTAAPVRANILATTQQSFPNARVYDNVRFVAPASEPQGNLVPAPASGSSSEFTDGIIGEPIGRNLVVRGVVEVKSGGRGGYEATTQTFKWNERILQPGARVRVPGPNGGVEEYVYDPTAQLRNADGSVPGRVIFLLSAPRYVIAPDPGLALGADSADQIAGPLSRGAHPATAEEINYLTRLAAEALIAGHVPGVPAAEVATGAPTP